MSIPDYPSIFLPNSLKFLKQNPFLSDLLLADCNDDLDEVAALIEPLLTAPKRCQQTGLYIQAVTTGYNAFLATNLTEDQIVEVTPLSSSWLVGRSATCAISIPHNSVSRRHAVLGHHLFKGFYITDLGSLNGTWVNRHRVMPTERILLQDGDLLQVGVLQVEFFLARRQQMPNSSDETDC